MATGLQLAYTDAYARATDGRVVSVGPDGAPAVVLDRTVFYPGGGGQPADTGSLRRTADGTTWVVRSAHKAEGEIAHDLAIAACHRRTCCRRLATS